ncbi:precorrin-4 C11-methyltransferase [Micromonospora sp. R77]|uniref:precorrin-4 C11-methyltransferase n=1 Tax=Micromonospora sp. R77 TaxID=2925836 RepID=UPI001F607B27|nr:precorrin-4 C11-methyltransferase [Micromonospora sp. R77]MCI4062807.1 precorrin-4 C11-methyltransferase [Micromonospora sp. R77]
MSEGHPVTENAPTSVPQDACPGWCRGCGPNDPMHRGFIATIGRERTGWVSLQLLIDRFARRDLAVKLDATRYGATQTVLLSAAQLDRLVDELTRAREVMRAPVSRRPRTGEAR